MNQQLFEDIDIDYDLVYDELYELAHNYYHRSDDEKYDNDNNRAFLIFYYLAVNDDADGLYFAGRMLEEGWGVSQDYGKAFELYKRASEKGDCDAKIRLGLFYDNGKGVEQDFAMAAKLYIEALEKNDITYDEHGDFRAEIRLGEMYEKGEGVEQSFDKAIECYAEYSDWDDIAFRVAEIYNNNEYLGKDLDKAIEWYERSALQGYALSREKLVDIYDSRAIEKDDMFYWYELGEKYEEGLYVDKDDVKAFKCFLKSVENVEKYHDEGFYKVGKYYLFGIGVEADYAEARKWLEKSAFENNNNALNLLGCIYKDGLGVVKDSVKAVELFLSSALKLNADAINNILCMYKDGMCTEVDKTVAETLIRKRIIENYKWLINIIFDDSECVYLYDADFNIFKEKFDGMLCDLRDREKEVLTLRFGLEDGKRKSLREVGERFGVTSGRIRQIEAKAIRRLRFKRRNADLFAKIVDNSNDDKSFGNDISPVSELPSIEELGL